jgi:hypothetical protein
LLEPSRTNQIRLSEYFEDTTIYDLRSADIVTNYAISPEGVKNATKVIPQNGTTNFRIQTQHTFGVSGDNVLSVFAKYESGGFQYLILATNSAFQTYAFDIQNGTKVGNAGGATIADEDATIELIGNGWYRCSIKSNNTGIADGVIYLSNDGTNASATGDGSKGMLIYGFQGEANASYPTSYIPNHSGTGSVTRGADDVYATGLSSSIGQTEGTIYGEFIVNATGLTIGRERITINDGTTSNWIFMGVEDINEIRVFVRMNASAIFNSETSDSPIIAGAVNKLAFGYKSGDIAVYLNGTQIITSSITYTSPSSPIDDLIISGANYIAGNSGQEISTNTKQVLLFDTRLSNADLATLTTL